METMKNNLKKYSKDLAMMATDFFGFINSSTFMVDRIDEFPWGKRLAIVNPEDFPEGIYEEESDWFMVYLDEEGTNRIDLKKQRIWVRDYDMCSPYSTHFRWDYEKNNLATPNHEVWASVYYNDDDEEEVWNLLKEPHFIPREKGFLLKIFLKDYIEISIPYFMNLIQEWIDGIKMKEELAEDIAQIEKFIWKNPLDGDYKGDGENPTLTKWSSWEFDDNE